MDYPETLEGLLLKAHQAAIECSLSDLMSYPEFSGQGVFAALENVAKKLESVGLSIHPPVTEGELDHKRIMSRAATKERFRTAFEEALNAGEGQEVEFKESLYVKKAVFGNEKVPKEYWVSEEIVLECIKTLCAFLNADGGTLLIGVADDHTVAGIDCELELVPGGDGTLDKWELFFTNCLQKYIHDYSACAGYISRKIIEDEGLNVCVVIVTKRTTALTACRSPNSATDENVFVRDGNGSKNLKARAIEELVKRRLRVS